MFHASLNTRLSGVTMIPWQSISDRMFCRVLAGYLSYRELVTLKELLPGRLPAVSASVL